MSRKYSPASSSAKAHPKPVPLTSPLVSAPIPLPHFLFSHLLFPFSLPSPVPYLDNNATTRPTEAVCQAVAIANRDLWQNPASIHRQGQKVRNAVELARADIAELLAVKPRTITFTGSGTESIHLAIRGLLARHQRPILVTTALEHSAIRLLAEELEKHHNAEVRLLPLLPGGLIDLAAAQPIIEGAHLVSAQWVNNETGLIQPIEELAKLCKNAAVPLHTDATQLVGRAPTPDPLPVDLLTCSAHKFHGPKGLGILYARPGLGLRPLFPGSEELGRRAGTLNTPAILGTAAAAREAINWLKADTPHEPGAVVAAPSNHDQDNQNTRGGGFQPPITHLESLRNRLETSILKACPGSTINCADSPRLWTTASIAFPGLDAEALLILLSEKGLAASAGAACSSGAREPSKVLLAMGIDEKAAHGTIRLSLSRFTTDSDIEQAIQIVTAAVTRLSKTT
jgi:cysteine desulfurase